VQPEKIIKEGRKTKMRLPNLSMTSWIFLGFISGILFGLFFGDLLSIFWVIGIAIFFSFQLSFPSLKTASFFSTQDLELQVFLLSLAVLAALLVVGIFPLLISCFTTFSYREIISASSRAIILGFSVARSL